MANAIEENIVDQNHLQLQNYVYSQEWQGTALTVLSYQQAASLSRQGTTNEFVMGRWPDPVLRRPASPVSLDVLKMNPEKTKDIANMLRRTARRNNAVGLAAQQCGIDVSMIFLQSKAKKSFSSDAADQGGLFLVNPRIISRSSEMDMKVWIEECLVLPPTFRATVLRDAVVQVEYEDLAGNTRQIQLTDELSRAFQHELDHDRGVLIVDHVGLDELESDDMKRIEAKDHSKRQAMAFSRFVSEETTTTSKEDSKRLLTNFRRTIVPDVSAHEDGSVTSMESKNAIATKNNDYECNEACLQERKRIIQERRAMMNQSRTNTKRSDLFELSRQRATLYNTSYKGAACPPNGIPCY